MGVLAEQGEQRTGLDTLHARQTERHEFRKHREPNQGAGLQSLGPGRSETNGRETAFQTDQRPAEVERGNEVFA